MRRFDMKATLVTGVAAVTAIALGIVAFAAGARHDGGGARAGGGGAHQSIGRVGAGGGRAEHAPAQRPAAGHANISKPNVSRPSMSNAVRPSAPAHAQLPAR